MRRARPMAGCGMSPSPAISFDVSTMTTRLPRSSASTRAASRSIVVLPMPGRPMIRIDFPVSTMSSMISIVPNTARPIAAGQPDDLAVPVADGARCGAASARCRRGCRRRTTPMWSTTYAMSALGDLALEQHHLAVREARLRAAAEVEDDLDQRAPVRQRVDGVDDLRRQRPQQELEVVDRFALRSGGHWCLLLASEAPVGGRGVPVVGRSTDGRHECRFGDPDQRFLHQQRDRGDRLEARLLEAAVDG